MSDANSTPTTTTPADDATFDLVTAEDRAADTQTESDDMATKAPPAPTANGTPKAAKKAAKPKAAKAKAIGIQEPAGTLQNLELKGLTFDRRTQMRAAVVDEATVEKYRESYQDDPNTLPPIKVMRIPAEEAEALKLPSNLVVYDGFQRGEARQRAKLKTIPCRVADGTWETARLLAIKANHDAALPRTPADLRRAFHQLLNDEDMLKEVLSWGVGNGGAQRALAAAAGVSLGLVNKILQQLGKTTDRGRIVDIDGTRTRTPNGTQRHQRDGDPDPAIRQESKEAIAKRATAVIIKEMQNAAASLQRRVEALLSREDAANLFREIANKHGAAIVRDEQAGGKNAAEYCPPVDLILGIMDEVADQHKRLTTDATKS